MRKFSVILATVAGVSLLASCGAVQDAANAATAADRALTTAQVCLSALGAVDFSIDPDPQAALEQTHQAADELNGLAEQAADVTVADAIADTADRLASVTLADLASPIDWLATRTEQAADLLRACS